MSSPLPACPQDSLVQYLLISQWDDHADDDAKFLHGIFEGMTNIEGDAYDLLKRMGASSLTEVSHLSWNSRPNALFLIRLAFAPGVQMEGHSGLHARR